MVLEFNQKQTSKICVVYLLELKKAATEKNGVSYEWHNPLVNRRVIVRKQPILIIESFYFGRYAEHIPNIYWSAVQIKDIDSMMCKKLSEI